MKLALEYGERRERWRGLVAPLVAAADGGSFSARCAAVGRSFGVGWKPVAGYAGGASGKETPSLPDADGLARICRVNNWNPLYVLYGPPHPERPGDRVSVRDLEAELAAHLQTTLADATKAGRLPPVRSPMSVALSRKLGVVGPSTPRDGAPWRVDGAGALAAAVAAAEHAASQYAEAVTRYHDVWGLARELGEAVEDVDEWIVNQSVPSVRSLARSARGMLPALDALADAAAREAMGRASYVALAGISPPREAGTSRRARPEEAPPAPQPRAALAVVAGAAAGR